MTIEILETRCELKEAVVANKVSRCSHGQFVALAALSVLSFLMSAPARASEIQRLNSDSLEISDSNLILYGLVDRVQASSEDIELLGQTLVFPRNEAGQLGEDLVGRVVAVYGSIGPDGLYRVSVIRQLVSTEYVPGTTRVLLTGRISMIDRTYAVAKIGSQIVDFTGALHKLNSDDIRVGDVVTFKGVRYSGDARLYAEDGNLRNITPDGQTGSGARTFGQTGSGAVAAGQTGSGARTFGQTGSGAVAAGQTGSGARTFGQTGSGAVAAGQTGSGA
jgi:hypothetical protein